MANRAVITTAPFGLDNVGIYVHWNGGPESIAAFLGAAQRMGTPSPEKDPARAMARLTQVIANYFGNSDSIGIGRVRDLDYANQENGTYLIGGDWEILGRDFWGEDGPIDSDRRQRIEDEVVHKTVVLSNKPEQAVKTNVAKTKSGWQASTRIDLVDGRILQVKTAKSLDGSLGTTALVHEVRRVNGNLTEDHNPRTDFGRRMVSWNVRETEQQVREQHQLALGMVEQLLPLIAKHYGG